MKHIGIVAEYNPFHNGHAYQIEQIKKLFPDKGIIVIMSGNFVQRGEPAIFEKKLRANCALLSGADIVFELPSYYATASAEYFATAALRLLNSTGVIDTLCFGAECDDLSLLKTIADITLSEPDPYKDSLKCYLAKGYNFPRARSLAIAEYLGDEAYKDILDKPNNILAIEYLKTIKRDNLSINPVIIKRKDSDYSNTELTKGFPSATALREYAKKMYCDNNYSKANKAAPINFKENIPDKCQDFLSKNEFARPLFFDDFYAEIKYALWANQKKFDSYLDISCDIANRIKNIYSETSDIEEIIKSASAKNYTTARIKRSLLHILLGLYKNDAAYDKTTGVRYIRLLGFDSSAAGILHEIKNNSTIPIINKVADANRILSETQYELFEKELNISSLYRQIYSNKYGLNMPSEYRQSVIIKK